MLPLVVDIAEQSKQMSNLVTQEDKDRNLQNLCIPVKSLLDQFLVRNLPTKASDGTKET